MHATTERMWELSRSVLAKAWARVTIPTEDKRRLVSVDALRAIAIAGMLLMNNHAATGTNPLPFVHVE